MYLQAAYEALSLSQELGYEILQCAEALTFCVTDKFNKSTQKYKQ
jgi:hypothetical protein